ncbi:MAG: aldo/keto reductase [Microcoleaceae cyanobacterium]
MTTTNTSDTKILGKTGISVPALCIGTWAWGDGLFWQYGKTYGETDVEKAFDAAIAAGVNFFDTAEVYGQGESEELLGKFMKKQDQPVLMATKYGPLPWRVWGSSVAEAVTASLKRLKLPQITLYQVHWPFTFFMSQETLINALADEVEQSRILAVGVSNYSAAEMRQAHDILAKRGIPLATNQVRYSLLARKVESRGILATAQELGITVLAYSPLAQGLLTGKYTGEHPPVGPRQFDAKFSKKGLGKIEPVLAQMRQIGEKYGRTPAQVALNWLNFQPEVIAISGAKTATQVEDNVGALGWRMSPEEWQQLEEMTRPWLSDH